MGSFPLRSIYRSRRPSLGSAAAVPGACVQGPAGQEGTTPDVDAPVRAPPSPMATPHCELIGSLPWFAHL